MNKVLEGLNIQIFTRSCNDHLFQLSGKTINLPYKKNKLKFTTGAGYFYQIMKSDADIVINIDEDAFIVDNKELLNLLVYFVENNYVNCGMPDGGVVQVRCHNPLVINPFFNIMDLRVLRKDFNLDIMKRYKVFDPKYIEKTNQKLMKTDFIYDMFEPYYPFFLWINQNYKVLDLDARTRSDGFTTTLLNQNQKPFLYHTWYSRSYGNDSFHTERIKNIMEECGIEDTTYSKNFWETVENKIFFRWVVRFWKVLNFIGLRKYV